MRVSWLFSPHLAFAVIGEDGAIISPCSISISVRPKVDKQTGDSALTFKFPVVIRNTILGGTGSEYTNFRYSAAELSLRNTDQQIVMSMDLTPHAAKANYLPSTIVDRAEPISEVADIFKFDDDDDIFPLQPSQLLHLKFIRYTDINDFTPSLANGQKASLAPPQRASPPTLSQDTL